MFGRYLVHYSVLRTLYGYVRKGKSGTVPITVVESAVFPNEIDNLVEEAFQAICRELEVWRQKARN